MILISGIWCVAGDDESLSRREGLTGGSREEVLVVHFCIFSFCCLYNSCVSSIFGNGSLLRDCITFLHSTFENRHVSKIKCYLFDVCTNLLNIFWVSEERGSM